MYGLRVIAFRLLLLLVTINAWAGNNSRTVIVEPSTPIMDLSERMTLLSDPDRKLVFSEVLQQLDQFQPTTRLDLVTSFNPAAFWLRISLLNTSKDTFVRWIATGNAKTQRVTFHVKYDEGWQISKSGRSIALLEKPIASLSPVFPITLRPGQEVDILIYIDSRGATDMATRLFEPQLYLQSEGKSLVSQALLLGGLLISSVLALMVFSRLRETQYLWLGLLLIGVAGLEASRENFLGTYVWPIHLPLPPQTLAIFACLVIFGMSKVVSHALELSRRIPDAERLLFVLRWLAVIGCLVTFWNYGHGVRIMSGTSVVQNIATLLLSLQALRHDQLATRIFPAAFSLALLTEIARQLANLGMIPWIAAMDFSTYFFLLATPLILIGLVQQTRQLSEKLQVAEQIQRAKTDFFVRISHELRSPLNTILGLSRMLARGSSRLTLTEGTGGIETNTLRLLRLIDEILDDARAAAGRLNITPVSMQLKPWLDEIATTSRLIVEDKGNRFETEFSGFLNVTLTADGERLRQVINNLISNANRYTHQGEIRLSCKATMLDDEIRLDFAVTDTGEGINDNRLNKIFEPFERGASASSGHGLGLSICHEIVRQMGGDISVTSSIGKGSVFSFSILCSTADHITNFKEKTAANSESTGAYRVLIVDDDPIQLNFLVAQLENTNFLVNPTTVGEIALHALKDEQIDLLITDQMMPGINGWGILERARTVATDLPIVLISSTTPCRPDTFPREIAFDAMLQKPLSSEEIIGLCWYQILKRKSPEFLLEMDWMHLAYLADSGDVSGIEDWLNESRGNHFANQPIIAYLESLSLELNLTQIKHFAEEIQRLLRESGHLVK